MKTIEFNTTYTVNKLTRLGRPGDIWAVLYGDRPAGHIVAGTDKY
jgi:hypothetical protein